MIGFSSLVDGYFDRMSGDSVLENVRATIEIGHSMTSIIDGLLLLAKMNHAPDFDLEMDSLDMHTIIERVTLNLNNAIRESRAHIYLPENLPTAKGYAGWVEEIWMNYISNAIKYGGCPPVIRLGADALDNGHVHFWVQDNGQGLSSDEQQQIFRPFVRLRKQEVSGNGLGLVIVKKIVERLDGSISLESEVGKGSQFGFILPMAELSNENELAVMND
jgi:signal transduction histidine kinase